MNRAVFYLPGFDPRGERFYKRVFKNELRKFSKSTNQDTNFQQVDSFKYIIKSNTSNCDLFFLNWINIINLIYKKSAFITWVSNLFSTLMIFISNHKSPKNILDYKHQLFLLSIILIDSTFFAFIILLVFIPFISGQYVISIILLVTSIFLVYLYKKLQNKIIPEKVRLWTQGFISLAYFSKKYKPHFEENAEKHADIIINCLNEGKHDEYILLAHSAGCYPLIFLLARLPTEHLKKIKIITMGHCIPVYINLKHFQENKTNIISSLKKTNTLWLDVYSPADPVSSRINTEKEFLYLGIDSKNSKFFNMYEDETYLKLKENPLAIHFQYIMSGDKPINTLNFYKILTSNNPINNYEI